MKTIFMFSGLGSQYFQMGRDLYLQRGTFWRSMQQLDEIARVHLGQSVLDEIYARGRQPGHPFSQLMVIHPAIFMVEYSLARTLIDQGVEPEMTLGASLGTFAAAVLAGCCSSEEALKSIIHQARAFLECCAQGGMLAVLGPVELYDAEPLRQHCELAAINFSTHFVVAARHDTLPDIETFLRAQTVVHHRLPVPVAFHSRWIEAAEQPYRRALSALRLRAPELPLVCCMKGGPVTKLDADHLWSIVRQPILFAQTIEQLERTGPHAYIDAGPAGTLATFLKYCLQPGSRSTVHATLTPYGRDLQNLSALTARAAY